MDLSGPLSTVELLLHAAIQGVAALRENVIQLTRNNEQLETQLTRLKTDVKELELLRKERKALTGAISWLMRSGGFFSEYGRVAEGSDGANLASLPLELVFRIFKETMVPPHCFDPSITYGAQNPWLHEIRTRKALPLICKALFWVGMDALYNDVVIRRMGQITRLAHTLRSHANRTTLATMIKTVRIDSCPIWAPYAGVIQEDLAFILSSTISLHDFSYHPHHQFQIFHEPPQGNNLDGYFNPTWFFHGFSHVSQPLLKVPITSYLHTLDLGMSLDPPTLRDIHYLLSGATLLRSLALGGPMRGFLHSPELLQLPPLTLPSLRELQFYFGTEPEYDNYVMSHWELPVLANMTVFLRENVELGSLLERFGARIIYLHLFPIGHAIHGQNRLCDPCTSLGRTCPIIQHLVLPLAHPHPENVPTGRTIIIHSNTLKYLDVWLELEAESINLNVQPDCLTNPQLVDPCSVIPALTTIRLLASSPDHRGWNTWVRTPTRNPDWPRICSPNLIPPSASEVLYHRFAKGWVAQTAWAVLPQEHSYCDTGRDLYRENWPDVYVCEEAPEGSDGGIEEARSNEYDIESDDSTYEPSDDAEETSSGISGVSDTRSERSESAIDIQDPEDDLHHHEL